MQSSYATLSTLHRCTFEATRAEARGHQLPRLRSDVPYRSHDRKTSNVVGVTVCLRFRRFFLLNRQFFGSSIEERLYQSASALCAAYAIDQARTSTVKNFVVIVHRFRGYLRLIDCFPKPTRPKCLDVFFTILNCDVRLFLA